MSDENVMVYGSRSLGARLHEWHHGMMDPIYRVGSMFAAGEATSLAEVNEALEGLERIHSQRKKYKLSANNVRILNAVIADLHDAMWSAKDEAGIGYAEKPSKRRSNPKKATKRELALRSLGASAAAASDLHRRMSSVEKTGGSHDEVDGILSSADQAIEGYGVEAIEGDNADRYYRNIVALYVNTGDTYKGTVLYNATTNRFSVTTVGDFVERNGRRLGID